MAADTSEPVRGRSAVALGAVMAVAFALVALPSTATADGPVVYEVTTTDDLALAMGEVECPAAEGIPCSLRAAVQFANNRPDGTQVEIRMPPGDYVLSIAEAGTGDASAGELDVTFNGVLTIIGDGKGATTIDAGGEASGVGRAFRVVGDVGFHLRDLSVVQGFASGDAGAVWLSSATTAVSFTRVRFADNVATDSGGAVRSTANATMSLSDVDLEDNVAGGSGGGLYTENAVSVVGGVFARNQAGDSGGAIRGSSGTIAVSSAGFVANTAGGNGGAIRNSGGSVLISGSDLVDNQAGNHGGAIRTAGGDVAVSDSDLVGNKAERNGGAIRTSGGVVRVSGSAFIGNEAGENGGAIRTSGGDVPVSGSAFIGNTADANGGAVRSGSGTVRISFSLFSANSSAGSGGAVTVGDADVRISGSTFAGNEAGGLGGAVNTSGDAIVSTSTFTDNRSDGPGSAISGADITVTSATIADNVSLATNPPAQLSSADADDGILITRTIVVGETPGCDGDGPIVSGGHNLGTDASCDLSAASSDLIGVDAQLLELGDNGGVTPTRLLSANSPARDAGGDGCSGDDDQRGVPRPQGDACDIGAVELGYGNVIGTVTTEAGDPIAGATVFLNPTTASDTEGAFGFDNLVEGPVILRAEAEGFQPGEVSATVRHDETIDVGSIVLLAPTDPEEDEEAVLIGVDDEDAEDAEELPATGGGGSLLLIAVLSIAVGLGLRSSPAARRSHRRAGA